jgi:hypothetical protein
MRIPKKGLVLPNGNRLSQGQLFPKREATMAGQIETMQRAMNRTPGAAPNTAPEGLARNNVSKVLPTLAIAHGMRDVSAAGHPLAFVGGKRPLDDETLEKTWQGKGNVPTHDGMYTHPKSNDGDRLRGKADPEDGRRVLDEAGRLGRKA